MAYVMKYQITELLQIEHMKGIEQSSYLMTADLRTELAYQTSVLNTHTNLLSAFPIFVGKLVE